MSLENLTVEEKKLLGELWLQFKGAGVVGIKETRNFIEAIIPEFADIRDSELDEFLDEVVKNPPPSYPQTFED